MSVKLSIFDNLQKRAFRTPDYHELRKRPECALFVYDSLKKGSWENQKFLTNALFLGEAQTLSMGFMMKIDKTGNPIVFQKDTRVDPVYAPIQGEMYLLSPQHIALIDEYYQNSSMVHRILQRFILFDQDDSKALSRFKTWPWCLGFIYVANDEAWKAHSTSFRTIRSYKTNSPETFKTRKRYDWDLWEKDTANWKYGGFGSPVMGHGAIWGDTDLDDWDGAL